MNTKAILALASLMLIAVFPASAEEVVYSANGTLDGYVDCTDARVVLGSWTIKVTIRSDVTAKIGYTTRLGKPFYQIS